MAELVAQGYAIKYPQNVSHLILANSFHSFLMWQENCDNSNHEIKTNYPEVWKDLMEATRTRSSFKRSNSSGYLQSCSVRIFIRLQS